MPLLILAPCYVKFILALTSNHFMSILVWKKWEKNESLINLGLWSGKARSCKLPLLKCTNVGPILKSLCTRMILQILQNTYVHKVKYIEMHFGLLFWLWNSNQERQHFEEYVNLVNENISSCKFYRSGLFVGCCADQVLKINKVPTWAQSLLLRRHNFVSWKLGHIWQTLTSLVHFRKVTWSRINPKPQDAIYVPLKPVQKKRKFIMFVCISG
jgi:hypothetical protein